MTLLFAIFLLESVAVHLKNENQNVTIHRNHFYQEINLVGLTSRREAGLKFMITFVYIESNSKINHRFGARKLAP